MFPGYRDFDVTRKADKFVIIVPDEKAGRPALPARAGVDIVLNWFSELQQRVAVKSDLLHVDHESSTLHRGGGP